MLKMTILTCIWSVQHLKPGRNIHHTTNHVYWNKKMNQKSIVISNINKQWYHYSKWQSSKSLYVHLVIFYFYFYFYLFLCLPSGIAPLSPDQRLGLFSPHQWGGWNCQRFRAYLFRFVRSFRNSWIASSPLDVAVFLFSRLIFVRRALYIGDQTTSIILSVDWQKP